MLLAVPKRKEDSYFQKVRELEKKHFQFFKKHSQNVRSIFNSSKSILKA